MTVAGSSYRQWPADPALADSVACVWISEIRELAAPPSDRVLPDACIDIVWDTDTLIIAGPDTGPVPLPDRPGASFAGVRFRTGQARRFLRVPASELLDQRVNLSDLWGRRSSQRLIGRLRAASSLPAAAQVLEQSLLALGSEAGRAAPVVDGLIARLGSTGKPATSPLPRTRSISRQIGVSERELRRRCHAAVGYGPKTLDRILRFQRARSLAPAASTLADLAAGAGYSDQAHLTRECQRLAGMTPSVLFKTPQRPLP